MYRTSSRVQRSWALLLALGLLACGQDRPTPASPEAPVDASPAGADGPTVAVAMDAASQAPPEWVLFDDFEGGGKFAPYWAMSVAPAPRRAAPQEDLAPPRLASRRALRLEGGPGSEGVDVSTHQHLDWTTMFSAVRFWARSDGVEASDLIVALTDIRSDFRTFQEDQRDGRPWKIKRVSLGPEWRLYTIAFEELAAETAGSPTAVYGPGAGPEGGSELHFVLPPQRAYALWVDDVELKCRPETCASIVFAHAPP